MSPTTAPPSHSVIACGVESQVVSAPALAEAHRLAAATGARLVLVHVTGSMTGFSPQEEIRTEQIADAHRWLDPLAASIGGEPVVIVGDDPADAMHEWIESGGADMLVICPHREGLSRLLGSFASAIVRSAPCPVVLCPHP
jgi:nucleotide-binding universal stress UspA family protein